VQVPRLFARALPLATGEAHRDSVVGIRKSGAGA
jgi:hypothetical protein